MAVGTCQEGEMGSGLTLVPTSRTLKSRCLPQCLGGDSPVCAEAVAVQEDTWKPLRDFCLRGAIPCRGVKEGSAAELLCKPVQASVRQQGVFVSCPGRGQAQEEKQIYVCDSIFCRLLAALAPEALPALDVHQPNTCWEPVSSHPGSPRLIPV